MPNEPNRARIGQSWLMADPQIEPTGLERFRQHIEGCADCQSGPLAMCLAGAEIALAAFKANGGPHPDPYRCRHCGLAFLEVEERRMHEAECEVPG